MQTHNELPVANDLLGAMPRQVYRRMQTSLESVELTYGQVLYEPMGSIRHVYFPIDCLVSLLTAVDQNRTLEVGMVGNEGMAGMPMALGICVSAVFVLVQGRGTALRMMAARGVEDPLPRQEEGPAMGAHSCSVRAMPESCAAGAKPALRSIVPMFAGRQSAKAVLGNLGQVIHARTSAVSAARSWREEPRDHYLDRAKTCFGKSRAVVDQAMISPKQSVRHRTDRPGCMAQGVVRGVGSDAPESEAGGIMKFRPDLAAAVALPPGAGLVHGPDRPTLNGCVWRGGYDGAWVLILVVVIVGLLVTGCLLSPMVTALAMSLSSVSVIGNALRLHQVRTAPAEPRRRSGLFATSSSHGR